MEDKNRKRSKVLSRVSSDVKRGDSKKKRKPEKVNRYMEDQLKKFGFLDDDGNYTDKVKKV